MLLRKKSMKWAGVVLLAGVMVASTGGCAWIHGGDREARNERPAVASRGADNAFEAGAEAPEAAERRSPLSPGRRDPFSRSRAPRYQAAAGAAVGEVGALAADEPGIVEEFVREAGGVLVEDEPVEGEAGGEAAAAAELPPVGAGPDEDDARSRRALWIAMVLVVGIGLTAMWLSRRQTS